MTIISLILLWSIKKVGKKGSHGLPIWCQLLLIQWQTSVQMKILLCHQHYTRANRLLYWGLDAHVITSSRSKAACGGNHTCNRVSSKILQRMFYCFDICDQLIAFKSEFYHHRGEICCNDGLQAGLLINSAPDHIPECTAGNLLPSRTLSLRPHLFLKVPSTLAVCNRHSALNFLKIYLNAYNIMLLLPPGKSTSLLTVLPPSSGLR
jgi:hypothetical protein